MSTENTMAKLRVGSAQASGARAARTARPADLDAVIGLLAAAKLPTEGVAQGFGEGYAVVEHAGNIAGTAGIEVYGGVGLLRSVAVDARVRGNGLGETLVRDRLAWAEARGLKAIYLLTTTAAGYFPRFGFQPVDRSSVPREIQDSAEFRFLCPTSAVVMYLLIAGDGRWVREAVRKKYAGAARSAQHGTAACCGASSELSPGSGCVSNPITSNLYDDSQTASIPATARLASLGCGNPSALAKLNPGETVLDLGSGGGIDVLLSAKRVGPTGKVYGLDMTDEMLALARENQRKAGIQNVEFLKGEIENIPLPDNSVDVIISNCVINLSADKDRVLQEAFRVLKPGGRFAVSDVVIRGEVPTDIRRSVELWVGCVAGALQESEYRTKLAVAGFEAIEIKPTRIYHVEDARQVLVSGGIDVDRIAPLVDGKLMSAFIRAKKPSSCCGPTSCSK